LVVLDSEHPRLVGRSPDGAIDAWLFGSAHGAIREVWVGGKRVVNGRHPRREEVEERFRTVARRTGG
jgi:formimidoylglutamate deiminase